VDNRQASRGYRTTVWGHGGALPGFRSALWYEPHRDVVIVALVNDWRANPQDLAELALRCVSRPAGVVGSNR
jgi:hypothetical protein